MRDIIIKSKQTSDVLPKKILLSIACAVLLVFGGAVSGWAGSLWSEQSDSLYINKMRPFHEGDLLTISIVEQASATQSADSSNSKSGDVNGNAGKGLLQFLPQLGAGWDSKSEGAGSTTRGGSLKARITVTVKEVMPNGNLKLEGMQQIKVNKENQTIKITGMARSEDVTSDNVISSTCIADAKIEFEGNGTVGEAQNTGLLTKIFHWLF